MHVIAIIATLLIMIPAALAGIVSGLGQCLSHRPDFAAVVEQAGTLLAILGPFGTGLLLIASSLFALIVMLLTAVTLLNRTT